MPWTSFSRFYKNLRVPVTHCRNYLKHEQRYDHTRVADGRARTASTLLRNDVTWPQKNDGQYNGINDPHQSDTHDDPYRNEYNLKHALSENIKSLWAVYCVCNCEHGPKNIYILVMADSTYVLLPTSSAVFQKSMLNKEDSKMKKTYQWSWCGTRVTITWRVSVGYSEQVIMSRNWKPKLKDCTIDMAALLNTVNMQVAAIVDTDVWIMDLRVSHAT